MRLAIRHTTRYHFAQPVARGLQRLRLRPKTTHGQKVLDWAMTLDGAKIEAEFDDHNANHAALVSILDGATSVAVTCTGTVETADTVGILGPHTGFMPLWCFLDQTPLTKPGPKLRALSASLESRRADPLDLLHALSATIADAVRYETGETDATTTAEQAVAHGHGVCQDHAHILIGAARHLGIPARYVSGYLMMDDRIEQDAGHAWAEAHIPGLGWVGFDVSNRVSPDARYVRVASGCDYRDAAPISGITFGAPGDSALSVSLSVEQQTIEQ